MFEGLSEAEQQVAESLVPIFPQLTADVIRQSVTHPSNWNTSTDVQLQYCIDDLLVLRTYSLSTGPQLPTTGDDEVDGAATVSDVDPLRAAAGAPISEDVDCHITASISSGYAVHGMSEEEQLQAALSASMTDLYSKDTKDGASLDESPKTIEVFQTDSYESQTSEPPLGRFDIGYSAKESNPFTIVNCSPNKGLQCTSDNPSTSKSECDSSHCMQFPSVNGQYTPQKKLKLMPSKPSPGKLSTYAARLPNTSPGYVAPSWESSRSNGFKSDITCLQKDGFHDFTNQTGPTVLPPVHLQNTSMPLPQSELPSSRNTVPCSRQPSITQAAQFDSFPVASSAVPVSVMPVSTSHMNGTHSQTTSLPEPVRHDDEHVSGEPGLSSPPSPTLDYMWDDWDSLPDLNPPPLIDLGDYENEDEDEDECFLTPPVPEITVESESSKSSPAYSPSSPNLLHDTGSGEPAKEMETQSLMDGSHCKGNVAIFSSDKQGTFGSIGLGTNSPYVAAGPSISHLGNNCFLPHCEEQEDVAVVKSCPSSSTVTVTNTSRKQKCISWPLASSPTLDVPLETETKHPVVITPPLVTCSNSTDEAGCLGGSALAPEVNLEERLTSISPDLISAGQETSGTATSASPDSSSREWFTDMGRRRKHRNRPITGAPHTRGALKEWNAQESKFHQRQWSPPALPAVFQYMDRPAAGSDSMPRHTSPPLAGSNLQPAGMMSRSLYRAMPPPAPPATPATLHHPLMSLITGSATAPTARQPACTMATSRTPAVIPLGFRSTFTEMNNGTAAPTAGPSNLEFMRPGGIVFGAPTVPVPSFPTSFPNRPVAMTIMRPPGSQGATFTGFQPYNNPYVVTSTSAPTATATRPPTATVTRPPTVTVTRPPTAAVTRPPTAAVTRPATATVTRPPTAAITRPPTATVTRPPTVTVTRPPTAAVTRPPTAAVTRPATATVTRPPTAAITRPPTATVTRPPTAAVTQPPTAAVTQPPTTAVIRPPTAAVTRPPTAAVTRPPTAAFTRPPTAAFPGPAASVSNPPAVSVAHPPAANLSGHPLFVAAAEPPGFFPILPGNQQPFVATTNSCGLVPTTQPPPMPSLPPPWHHPLPANFPPAATEEIIIPDRDPVFVPQEQAIVIGDEAARAGTSAPKSPKSRITEMMDGVRVLICDVETEYLRDLCERFQNDLNGLDKICNFLFEKPDYPRHKTPVASKPVTPEKVTKVSIDYNNEYETHMTDEAAVKLLQNDFKQISVSDLRHVVKAFNGHYAPSHKCFSDCLKKAGFSISNGHISDSSSSAKNKVLIEWPTHKFFTHERTITLLRCGRKKNLPCKISDPRLREEFDFVCGQLNKEVEMADQQLASKINENEYEESGQLIECGCCYGECPFESMVQCYEGHLFCDSCLHRYAKEAVYGQGKAELSCLDGECESSFPKSQLLKALPESIYLKYEERCKEENLNLAGLDDLVRCPHCDFAALLDPGDKVFKCQNIECMKETCRHCQEDWAEHFGIPCKEMEKKDETKLRTNFEEKMSQAKIRSCHRCKTGFMKSDGCNKMTCRCGAKMCYICRKPDIDYNHFCKHLREPGKNCSQCTACSLWTNPEQDDERAVAEIQKQAQEQDDERAVAEIQKQAQEARVEQGFTEQRVIGATDPPTAKKARLM